MDIDIIKGLDLNVFNEFCKAFFDQMGFRAAKTAPGSSPALSEVSILYGKSNNKPFSMFQCTNDVNSVPVLPVKIFKQAMFSAQLNNGYFLTTGRFTEISRDFASESNIHLIDAEKIISLAGKMPKASRDTIFEIAAAQEKASSCGHETNGRFCPECQTKMSLKLSSDTRKYWECPGWDCGKIVPAAM